MKVFYKRERESRKKIAELARGREEPGSTGCGAHGLGAVEGGRVWGDEHGSDVLLLLRHTCQGTRSSRQSPINAN